MEPEAAAGDTDEDVPDGRTALVLAAERGDLPTVRLLLRAGARREARALEAAIERREHELISALSDATDEGTEAEG